MTNPIIITLSLFLLMSCTSKTEFSSPPGYNLNAPEKMEMPADLFEISGITFLSGNSDTILAINDEEGKVFFFNFKGNKINSHKFSAVGGDFEDITIYNHQIYILKSNGSVVYINKDIIQKDVVSEELKNRFPEGEYEALYADEKSKKLYALCKKCKGVGKHEIQGYTLDLGSTGQTGIESFVIDITSMKYPLEKGFKPSALTKNKNTGEWFILSSKNKLLIVADEKFALKEAYPLNPEIYIQPEGITFDGEGNLYISNEGDKLNNGNVLKFKLDKK